MRTKKSKTRLQLNINFENYDMDLKNIFEKKKLKSGAQNWSTSCAS